MKHIGKIVLLIGALVGYLYLTNSPNLQFIRDSYWYIVAYYILVDGIVLYVMFKPAFKTSLPSKIILGLLVLLPLYRLFEINPKISLLLIYFHGLAIILTTIIVYYIKHINNEPKRQFETYPLIIGLILFILPVSTVNRFEYLGNTNFVWLYSAIIGVLFTLIAIILVIKYKDDIQEHENIYFIPLLTMMASVIFFGLSALFFNYVIDDSSPSDILVEIIDMDIDTGYRSLTTYDLTIAYNNEEYVIGTSQSMYYQLEIGDEITITYYEGAFGIEYLIYEP
ncbi:MAG: hypothetical protein CVV56_06600 [Tenericutes bacterium HGW-Tenericutes-1]|jgi:hypothetical protein|nr:MAG: hypothetical protein CVV56_06600 [Tenericutes bacterium HGW-Tenericutes-1]